MINLKGVKVNPEVFEDKNNEEGLIERMRCKNCLSLGKKEGKLWCLENNREVKIDEHCEFWSENLGVNNELHDTYLSIIEILKEFVDTKEENYTIIALWIIGTYIHKSFPTYPYLYINAMKGSGKTRLLKLIKELSKDGDMLASLSEAVLFRTTGTLCIDEFENINHKDKNSLRELLNTAYKKGGRVKRMRKKKTLEGEEQVVETFDTFRPIVIANITGIEDVLGDRCISFILEKSDNPIITKKIENFENQPKIQQIKRLCELQCSLCMKMPLENVYTEWNTYINIYTLTTLDTFTPLTTQITEQTSFFNKIWETGINGRNLELSFPLLILAEKIGVLDEFIKIMKNITDSKKEDDIVESRDIMLYDFVSKNDDYKKEHKLRELVTLFRSRIDYDEEDRWLNERWMGKALKRLNLIVDKIRHSEGIIVTLNVDKAKEKMKIFEK